MAFRPWFFLCALSRAEAESVRGDSLPSVRLRPQPRLGDVTLE